jgi:hypothetical protein
MQIKHDAKVVVLDEGHFALDTKAEEIADLVRGFMNHPDRSNQRAAARKRSASPLR